MDLIERYLAAVRRNLPAARADDIAAEIGDVLASHVEDREAALGRALTRDETAAMLRQFGHPLVVASRYREHQYLIGPETFPFYLFAMKVVLVVGATTLLVAAAASAVLGEGNGVRMVARMADDLWGFFFAAVAIVTIVFAVLERQNFPIEHLRKWTPESLPDFVPARRSQWESAIELGMGTAFLLWWVGAIDFAVLGHTESFRLEPAPVWNRYWLPVLVLISVSIVASLARLLLPGLRKLHIVLTLAVSALTLAILAGLYRAGEWVRAVPTGIDPDQLARIMQSVDLSLRIAFAVAVVVTLVQCAIELRRLFRPGP